MESLLITIYGNAIPRNSRKWETLATCSVNTWYVWNVSFLSVVIQHRDSLIQCILAIYMKSTVEERILAV